MKLKLPILFYQNQNKKEMCKMTNIWSMFLKNISGVIVVTVRKQFKVPQKSIGHFIGTKILLKISNSNES